MVNKRWLSFLLAASLMCSLLLCACAPGVRLTASEAPNKASEASAQESDRTPTAETTRPTESTQTPEPTPTPKAELVYYDFIQRNLEIDRGIYHPGDSDSIEDARGIVSAYIGDLNGDDVKEMTLVTLLSEDSDPSAQYGNAEVEVYTMKDGEVELADTLSLPGIASLHSEGAVSVQETADGTVLELVSEDANSSYFWVDQKAYSFDKDLKATCVLDSSLYFDGGDVYSEAEAIINGDVVATHADSYGSPDNADDPAYVDDTDAVIAAYENALKKLGYQFVSPWDENATVGPLLDADACPGQTKISVIGHPYVGSAHVEDYTTFLPYYSTFTRSHEPEESESPVAGGTSADGALSLINLAQAALFGGVTPFGEDAFQHLMYELYTAWSMIDPPYSEHSDTALYTVNDAHTLPVIKDAVQSGHEEPETNGSVVIQFDRDAVIALAQALYGSEAATEDKVDALAAAWAADTTYAPYAYPASESAIISVFYADTESFPHENDSSYTFRLYCPTADVGSTLCTITVTPDKRSPFGFIITGADWLLDYDVNVSANPEGLVFPESSSRYLSEADLQSLFAQMFLPHEISNILGFARNEIFARHGNQFDTEKYRTYFSQFDWYSPTHKVDISELNEFERANLDTIIAWEEEYSS